MSRGDGKERKTEMGDQIGYPAPTTDPADVIVVVVVEELGCSSYTTAKKVGEAETTF